MISIVIVTHNSLKTIKLCLDSIASQKSAGAEVIVVDNGSTDGTAAFIEKNHPSVVLIRNSGNEGASTARNQGIAQSRGRWILTLDSDCVLGDGFLAGFGAASAAFPPDAGMAQPDILSGDGKWIYSQGIHLSRMRRFHDLNSGKPRGSPLPAAKPLIGPCSAAGFYRRDMLEQLKESTGYFDERFFFLVEDVDLAWRAQRAGWKACHVPGLACYHDGNGSGTGRKLRQFLCFRNRYLMIGKNESGAGKLRVFALSAPYEISKIVYMLLFNKYLWMRVFLPLKSLAKCSIL